MTRYRAWRAVTAGLGLAASIAVGWAEEPGKAPAKWLLWDEPNQIGVTAVEFRQTLQTIPEPQRSTYQDDVQLGSKLLRAIYQQKRMAAEAERIKLDEQPDVQAQLAAARRQALAAALLKHNQREREGQTPDFEMLARERYLSHQDQYRTPEQLSLAQIWLKTSCECERPGKRDLVKMIQDKLKAGESFEVLAQQYSEDKSSAGTGGRLLLPISRGDADAPIETAVFALDQPGDLSDIVETEQGFRLFKLLERHPPVQRDFDTVKAEIIEQVKSQYLSVQMGDYLAQFEPGTDATINEELLKRQAFPQ